jgi:hypothetical protein
MNNKSEKIFSVTNKSTGKVERLIKAASKAQVNGHLLGGLKVEPINAVELLSFTSDGMSVETISTDLDAENQAAGAQESSAAATA